MPPIDRPTMWTAVDGERVEETEEVGGEILDLISASTGLGAAVAAKVVADAAIAVAEGGELGVPHVERATDRMGENDGRRRCGAGRFVEELDPLAWTVGTVSVSFSGG